MKSYLVDVNILFKNYKLKAYFIFCSSESFYSLYVGTGESDDPAWAAILNSSNLGIPYFIFNADPSMPHEFPRGEYNVYVI